MKIQEVAKRNGFDPRKFDDWVYKRKDNYKIHMGFGMNVEPEEAEKIASDYKQYLIDLKEAPQRRAREAAEAAARAEKMQKAMSEMLITSGFSFDGYTVTKYSGYISGDDVVQIARGTSGPFFGDAVDVGEGLSKALVTLRRNALRELKEAAYNLGCNAVIGVDFDYITLDPETANFAGGTTYLPYVFCVTANGNAVVIEKNP